MLLVWHRNAWEDYLYWQEHDRTLQERVNDLIKDILRHPFQGIGKPEPLRQNLKGYWSRRISGEHRLIYTVTGTGDQQAVTIIQCRFHY
ncbi:toxin YoeB [Xaviernesmea oryzae]|uniref:Putative mRNA interferase YoeB n=1 Tax=Xaviernesmea oryzae TaxID=464029 RepID=A0A1Q9AVL3_9HYPH|nr:Txe/YoeB family addiction module toxin [Xaviernesmea oryzae]OLP59454.1 toxin YoeB [Xaviernesmea oryzae]SEL59449.1 toxin YoeB [Xaviernesmea oryzae]